MSDMQWDEISEDDLEELNGYDSLNLENLIDEEMAGLSYSMVKNPNMTVSMTEQGLYGYQLPDKTTFAISIPRGMVTAGEVTFIPGEGQNVLEVYRDEELIYPSDYTFAEEGTYRLTLLSTEGMENTSNMVSYLTEVTFQIITPVTAALDELVTPKEFELLRVSCNGEVLDQASQSLIWEDGYYVCSWRAKADSSIIYQTDFTLDTQAPELIFSKNITQGAVRPPLTMEATEEGCTLTMKYGAEQAVMDTWELTQSGVYLLTVTDRAGNAQSYQVTIDLAVGNYFTYLFIILAVILAGAGLWLAFLRKHMQVL